MPNTHGRKRDASVIVNTYQQANTIDLALTALRQQDFTGDWEIIVVDDGSRDNTTNIVGQHMNTSDIPLALCQQEDRGNRWSAARNVGARESAGKILIFLDGDMVADRDLVRRHVEEQTREPGLLAGNRLWRHPSHDIDPNATPEQQLDELARSTASLDPIQQRRETYETRWRRELVTGPYPWRAWFGCHVSVPASNDVRFDEAMIGWGPADIELGYRLYHHGGMRVRYLHEIRAWHLEYDEAVNNPFRTGDGDSATQYVWQICHMITKHPDADLRSLMTMGFDRLVQVPDGSWTAVPRGEGGDPQQTLDAALVWYEALPADTTAAQPYGASGHPSPDGTSTFAHPPATQRAGS